MAKHEGNAFTALGSVTVTPAFDVRHLEELVVQISGTFVGTAQIEISQDGTNFAQFGANQTAPAVVQITVPCQQVRVRCSAFTSGSIVSTYGGRDNNRRG